MGRKTSSLLPATERLAEDLGQRLRLARLRRKLTTLQVCERAGMSPMTLRAVERGGTGATIGAYLAVMQVLGMQQDLAQLAKNDPLGRTIQDSGLRKSRSPVPAHPQTRRIEPENKLTTPATKAKTADSPQSGWQGLSGFSVDDFADLLQPSHPSPPKAKE